MVPVIITLKNKMRDRSEPTLKGFKIPPPPPNFAYDHQEINIYQKVQKIQASTAIRFEVWNSA